MFLASVLLATVTVVKTPERWLRENLNYWHVLWRIEGASADRFKPGLLVATGSIEEGGARHNAIRVLSNAELKILGCSSRQQK